jgi:CO/xanthine dehydrogenase Mo-binding subunit
MAESSKEFSIVGKKTPRIDAYERVTGQAQYTGDLQLPGMLYARVLRSSVPHAKIASIDTSKAEKLPGVKAIIHHGNAQVPWSSGGLTHRRYIFNNPVRYVGDPVAAVAATDRHIAEDALKLIEINYEKIPHVLDANEALKPDAPKITPNGNLSVGKGPFSAPIEESWGDVEQGFKEADKIFEDTFITKHVNNAQMERRVSIARWDAGKLTVYASTQGVSNARTDIAKDFGLPLSKVRVICKYMGGGFGNKNQAQDYDYMAAMLAKAADQPVKLEFTREDDFIGMHGRWSSEQHYKVGVKNDGTITAVMLDAVTNMGAYRKQSGNLSGTDFYNIPNFKKVVKPVHTNTVVAANYRAPRLSPVGLRLCVFSRSDRVRIGVESTRYVPAQSRAEIERQARIYLQLPGTVHCRRREAHWLARKMAQARRKRPVRKSMASGWPSAAIPFGQALALQPSESIQTVPRTCWSASPTSARVQNRRWRSSPRKRSAFRSTKFNSLTAIRT